MSLTTGDLSLFTKMVRDKLADKTLSYVDDTISVGDDGLDRESRVTERMFKSSARDYDDVNFPGIEVKKKKTGHILCIRRDMSASLSPLSSEPNKRP